MLHVGSALGLLFYYRRDWVEIVGAFFNTLRTRRAKTPNERLAWLIIIASIPAGVSGSCSSTSCARSPPSPKSRPSS